MAGWRRPTLGAWICLVAGVALGLGLGAWQLQRRAWKHDLVAKIHQRMEAPPLALGGLVGDREALDYRRVRITGQFAHDREIYLYPRFHNGHPGIHVVTPLLRRGFPPVLVNRGWVPAKRRDPKTRPEGKVPGTVTVVGVARTIYRAGSFTPRNDPSKGFWTGYDPPAMAQAVGLPGALPLVVEAERDTHRTALPFGGATRVNFPDNHLQYALTWFALAIVLTVLFAVAHRPRGDAT